MEEQNKEVKESTVQKREKHYGIVLLVLAVIVSTVAFGIFGIASEHTLSQSSNSVAIEQQDWYRHFPTKIGEVMKSVNTVGEYNEKTKLSGPGTKLDMDPSEIYIDKPNLKGSTARSVDVGGFILYKDPTWNSTTNTFLVNLQKANNLVYNAIKDNQSTEPSVSETTPLSDWARYMYGSLGSAKDGNMKKVPNRVSEAPAMYSDVNGIKCYLIAVGAAVTDKDWYTSGKWNDNTSVNDATYYGNYNNSVKYNVVLEKDGEDYYLPCVPGTAKAHTYPYGFAETFFAKQGSNIVGPNSWENTGIPVGLQNIDAMSKLCISKLGYDMTKPMSYIEFCAVSDKNVIGAIKKPFTLKGVIVYK